ncbi:MAG: hypothetical protein ACLVJ6_09200 [Merdibacter sp.]
MDANCSSSSCAAISIAAQSDVMPGEIRIDAAAGSQFFQQDQRQCGNLAGNRRSVPRARTGNKDVVMGRHSRMISSSSA